MNPSSSLDRLIVAIPSGPSGPSGSGSSGSLSPSPSGSPSPPFRPKSNLSIALSERRSNPNSPHLTFQLKSPSQCPSPPLSNQPVKSPLLQDKRSMKDNNNNNGSMNRSASYNNISDIAHLRKPPNPYSQDKAQGQQGHKSYHRNSNSSINLSMIPYALDNSQESYDYFKLNINNHFSQKDKEKQISTETIKTKDLISSALKKKFYFETIIQLSSTIKPSNSIILNQQQIQVSLENLTNLIYSSLNLLSPTRPPVLSNQFFLNFNNNNNSNNNNNNTIKNNNNPPSVGYKNEILAFRGTDLVNSILENVSHNENKNRNNNNSNSSHNNNNQLNDWGIRTRKAAIYLGAALNKLAIIQPIHFTNTMDNQLQKNNYNTMDHFNKNELSRNDRKPSMESISEIENNYSLDDNIDSNENDSYNIISSNVHYNNLVSNSDNELPLEYLLQKFSENSSFQDDSNLYTFTRPPLIILNNALVNNNMDDKNEIISPSEIQEKVLSGGLDYVSNLLHHSIKLLASLFNRFIQTNNANDHHVNDSLDVSPIKTLFEMDFKYFESLISELGFLSAESLNGANMTNSFHKAFYLNLYNCLFMHALVTQGRPFLNLNSGSNSQNYMDNNEITSFKRTYCYKVGPFILSLLDIEYGILFNGAHNLYETKSHPFTRLVHYPPNFNLEPAFNFDLYNILFVNNERQLVNFQFNSFNHSSVNPNDNNKLVTLPYPSNLSRISLCKSYLDPRLHFALINGVDQSPQLYIFSYNESLFDNEISLATASYISKNLTSDYEESIIPPNVMQKLLASPPKSPLPKPHHNPNSFNYSSSRDSPTFMALTPPLQEVVPLALRGKGVTISIHKQEKHQVSSEAEDNVSVSIKILDELTKSPTIPLKNNKDGSNNPIFSNLNKKNLDPRPTSTGIQSSNTDVTVSIGINPLVDKNVANIIPNDSTQNPSNFNINFSPSPSSSPIPNPYSYASNSTKIKSLKVSIPSLFSWFKVEFGVSSRMILSWISENLQLLEPDTASLIQDFATNQRATINIIEQSFTFSLDWLQSNSNPLYPNNTFSNPLNPSVTHAAVDSSDDDPEHNASLNNNSIHPNLKPYSSSEND